MKNKRIYVAIVLIAVIATSGLYVFVVQAGDLDIDAGELYPVTSVIDGDTFRIRVGKKTKTVRMLGIDTPETLDPRKDIQCFGPEASEKTKQLLQGRKVRLEFNKDREWHDAYGRYLAYVHRDDELFLNKFLIENGFAREYTFGRAYKFQADFRAVEIVAKMERRGMWMECGE